MRSHRADLTPPLGHPGGPCYVVRRIHDEVPSPRLREQLDDKVEIGQALTNPEANVVYRPHVIRGPGWIFRTITITPHAQYRMDLRGVWISEIKIAVEDFMKHLQRLSQRKDPEFESIQRDMQRDGYQYLDTRTQLVVVIAWNGRDEARIVTVYFKGDPDPRAPGLNACEIAARVASRWIQQGAKG